MASSGDRMCAEWRYAGLAALVLFLMTLLVAFPVSRAESVGVRPVDQEVGRPGVTVQPQTFALESSVARVTLAPSVADLAVGMTVTMDIVVSDVVGLYGVDLSLAFDPTIVRVVDADANEDGIQIVAGGDLLAEFVAANVVSNTLGTIRLAYTQVQPSQSLTGTGTVGSVTFRAKKSGISPITFTAIQLVNYGGVDLTSQSERGQVIVGTQSSLIQGQVHFQGRSDLPALDWACPISVSLHSPGVFTPTLILASSTNISGQFSIAGIAPATYDVKVRDLHSLWNVHRGLVLAAGANSIDFGTLIEGDANLDRVINILDFSIVSKAFDTVFPDPRFDPQADLNNSYSVNIVDFSLLAANFDRSGEIELSSGAGQR